MPREGVPYDGAENGCGIWCQIKQLWTIMRTKLKSINGVPGDGDGDVKLLAGTGVTINNDQLHNEITISAAGGSDAVKSVNGQTPDSDGDVAINTGVLTLNSIAPDSDGDFTISAGSNITITPGTNEIEISASGGTPTAKSPIYIDNDGDIALKDWVLYNSKDWDIFVNNNYVTEDVYIVVGGLLNSNYISGAVFIPKGTKLDSDAPTLDYQRSYSSGSGNRIIIGSIPYTNIFTSASNTTVYSSYRAIGATTSGSSADETLQIYYVSSATEQLSKIIDEEDSNVGIKIYRRA